MDELSFLNQASVAVAPQLIGCELVRQLDGQTIRGRIVEVEAYEQTDEASHSFRGLTPRTKVMFGPAGFLYVYFTYGMHFCANIVTGPAGYGSAVLIRAVEPLEGTEIMHSNRGHVKDRQLTNGPAKFCQAFMINRDLNGHDLRQEPLKLIVKPPFESSKITTTTRIGIKKAALKPWRFYETGNPFVSKLVK